VGIWRAEKRSRNLHLGGKSWGEKSKRAAVNRGAHGHQGARGRKESHKTLHSKGRGRKRGLSKTRDIPRKDEEKRKKEGQRKNPTGIRGKHVLFCVFDGHAGGRTAEQKKRTVEKGVNPELIKTMKGGGKGRKKGAKGDLVGEKHPVSKGKSEREEPVE